MLGAVRLPRVMLAAESLRPGASGIGRVARLVARVLADEARAGRLQAHALALNDPEPVTDLRLEVRSARGSRPRFVAQVPSTGLIAGLHAQQRELAIFGHVHQ